MNIPTQAVGKLSLPGTHLVFSNESSWERFLAHGGSTYQSFGREADLHGKCTVSMYMLGPEKFAGRI